MAMLPNEKLLTKAVAAALSVMPLVRASSQPAIGKIICPMATAVTSGMAQRHVPGFA